MSTSRDRESYVLLSRYEWAFCGLLAVLGVAGVTLEITRMAGKARKAKPSAAAVQEVGAAQVSTEAAAAENLSVR